MRAARALALLLGLFMAPAYAAPADGDRAVPGAIAPEPTPATPRPNLTVPVPRPEVPADAPLPPSLAVAVAEDDIAVTTTYSGARIIVFGHINERPATDPRVRPTDLVVSLVGPSDTATVRRREPVLGLWVPGEALEFAAVPAYIAVASEGPLEAAFSPEDLVRNRILPETRLVGFPADLTRDSFPAFREAVARIKARAGLYRVEPGKVRRLAGGLFRAEVPLPARAPPGIYRVEIRLYQDGREVAAQNTRFYVSRRGFERAIYALARDFSPLYALGTVLLALGMGAGAAWVFRRN